MLDLVKGLVGAAIVFAIPLLIAYIDYRIEKHEERKHNVPGWILNHLENDILDRINRRKG